MLPVAGLVGFVAVGLSLGMLGGGGSILAVPVLVNLMDVPAGIAVPMSLPVVGVAAAAGAAMRWRRGQLRLATAAIFTLVAMAASYLAARLGAGIPDRPRLLLFGAAMLVAAVALWRRSQRHPGEMERGGQPRPAIAVIPAAIVVGALTGVLGVGGGFLIVPALVGVLGLPMAEATATSLAVIALNTVAASAGFLTRHVRIDATVTAMVIAAALVGMALGTVLAPRFSGRTLARWFAVLLVVVAFLTIGKEVR
ncbi:MAG: sulfite exporter TauE/SafE family protein [Gemmatimonadales bacterium]